MSAGVRVEVQVRDPRWTAALPGVADVCETAALAALADTAADAEVGVVLVDDETIARLNATYRGRDAPTNVLAFEGDARPPAAGQPALLGDVVVAFETAAEEAAADPQIESLAGHLAHLVVHGVLHLRGFDHEDETEARAMEAREVEILAGLGVPDPYAAADGAPVPSRRSSHDTRRPPPVGAAAPRPIEP